MVVELTPEILLKFSTRGPRYTSYPTAPHWREDYPVEAFHAALGRLREPCEVYVHIPFCREQCTFCGCTMAVAGRREAGTRYLDALERQVDELPLPRDTVAVARIHLGGGTPTWLSPAEMERLYGILFRRFRPVEGAELSVEADPEVTTDEHVHVLRALGVNRLSLGVQSFDPVVLAAVNRPQEQARIHHVLELARSLGMRSANLDLIYGLPHQDEASFADTIRRTLEMRPDRLAIFGYAHVPWLKPHQKRIPADALPTPLQRVGLFLLAHRMLTEAGYEAIGMDHFALPDDELAVARRAGALHRNFMGYTTRPDLDMVGLGMSAISEFEDAYVQQKARLSRWWKAVETGASPVEKGIALTREDRLRRDVINRIMCNLVLPWKPVAERWDIDPAEHFADELARLAELERDGLVTLDADALRVTEFGRLLVRNVAMIFDTWLGRRDGRGSAGPRYSQTV